MNELLLQVLKPTHDRIDQMRSLIETWGAAADRQEELAWTLVALGLVIAGLQGWSQLTKNTQAPPTSKVSPVAVLLLFLPLAVTGVTGWMEKGFPADHREYRRQIAAARNLILQLERQEALLKGNPDINNPVLLPQLIADRIEPLEKKLDEIEVKLASTWSFPVTVAYAMSVSPLTRQGIGESNLSWQALQNAQTAASEAMVRELARLAGLQPTDRERAALRLYVEAYAKKQTPRQERGDAGRQRLSVELALSPAYLTPSLIKAYVASQASVGQDIPIEQQIRKLRDSSRVRPADGFLMLSTTLPAAGGTIALQAPRSNDGFFRFTFTSAVRPNSMAEVRLTKTEIRQDSSAGSTKWSFYLLSGDRVVLTLPEQRYDDGGNPTICYWGDAAGLTALVPAGATGSAVTLVGIRPKIQDRL